MLSRWLTLAPCWEPKTSETFHLNQRELGFGSFDGFSNLDFPFEIQEEFFERASIREFDGHQDRLEAELGALKELTPDLPLNIREVV